MCGCRSSAHFSFCTVQKHILVGHLYKYKRMETYNIQENTSLAGWYAHFHCDLFISAFLYWWDLFFFFNIPYNILYFFPRIHLSIMQESVGDYASVFFFVLYIFTIHFCYLPFTMPLSWPVKIFWFLFLQVTPPQLSPQVFKWLSYFLIGVFSWHDKWDHFFSLFNFS